MLELRGCLRFWVLLLVVWLNCLVRLLIFVVVRWWLGWLIVLCGCLCSVGLYVEVSWVCDVLLNYLGWLTVLILICLDMWFVCCFVSLLLGCLALGWVWWRLAIVVC